MPIDLFPWHPRFVHYPIAFTLAGVVLTFAALWRSAPSLERVGFWSLVAGWMGAMLAACAGLIDIGQLAPDDPRWSTLNLHITSGIALLIVLGGALYWRIRQRRGLTASNGRLYLAMLVVVALVVLVNGWLGGQLVYHLRLGVD